MSDLQIGPLSIGFPPPRLIPHVVSNHAHETPNKTWAAIPRSSTDASAGYDDISFARLNYAVTRAARWLQTTVEPHKAEKFEALAYVGPPDARYIIFTIAAIKTGFQLLLLSPRNSDEAQESVIEQAQCRKFLCSTLYEARINRFLESRPKLCGVTHFVVPEQEELLQDKFVPNLPYIKTFEEARSEPLVVLHTSSTTGIPKTIHLNQGYGFHEDIMQHVPNFNGLDIITRKPFYGDCRMFVAMPLFHAGGVLLTLLKSLYHGIVSVFQPPSAALSAGMFDSILRHGHCNGCVIPPYLLEEMLAVPPYFDTLVNLDFVQFGSGPLSHAVGELLLTRQRTCPHFIGSSEVGLFLLLELDDPVADWQYFRFHPWSGVDLRPLGVDGMTCELFIKRLNEPRIPGLQPVFELFPNLNEWSTNDIYARHPVKLDHWRCIGRNDDVLVLSNGEKLNPVDTESHVTNVHPNVTGALVIGQGKLAPGLLLEVKNADTTDRTIRARLIDDIWPSIQAANRQAPGHGQLSKTLILFTSSGKSFLRTPKWSIKRKPTTDLYAQEIEHMYAQYAERAEEDIGNASVTSLDVTSVDTIRTFISDAILSVTGWPSPPAPAEDLFMMGMDSLQAVRVTNLIKVVLAKCSCRGNFDTDTLYSHSTIDGLSQTIFSLVNTAQAMSGGMVIKRENAIERKIKEHSNFGFSLSDQKVRGKHRMNGERQSLNVILTGSTGSLGKYIVKSLLENPRVAKIYCLNRSESAKVSTLDVLGTNAGYREDLDERIRFLHTNVLGEPHLGLGDRDLYKSLQEAKISHVIHNAWPVNFNLSLNSFDSHLAGIHSLLEFCGSIPEPPKLLFVSSLSSVTQLSWKVPVPEAIVHDSSAPSAMGYGESKYAAEHILDNATRFSFGAIPTTVLRVGQIAGPVKTSTGIWPLREWLPSLIISSKTIAALPDSLGRMNDIAWTPVDLLADCISELLTDDVSNEYHHKSRVHQSDVYHAFNPHSVAWEDLLPTTMAQIDVKRTVPLADWVGLVRQGPDESSITTPNPARKIMQFYEGLVKQPRAGGEINGHGDGELQGGSRFEVEKLAKRSKAFKDMTPVSNEWMSSWIDKWF